MHTSHRTFFLLIYPSSSLLSAYSKHPYISKGERCFLQKLCPPDLESELFKVYKNQLRILGALEPKNLSPSQTEQRRIVGKTGPDLNKLRAIIPNFAGEANITLWSSMPCQIYHKQVWTSELECGFYAPETMICKSQTFNPCSHSLDTSHSVWTGQKDTRISQVLLLQISSTFSQLQ